MSTRTSGAQHDLKEMVGCLELVIPTSSGNESLTRVEIIDSQIAHTGWSCNRRTLVEEFLLKITESDRGYSREGLVPLIGKL
jgi:hypothetical protein